MNPLIPVKKLAPVFLIALACFTLLPRSQAVLPAPDGGYPGQNTAEGDNALFSLTTGVNNTAVGFQALFNNTIGTENTGTGVNALFRNTSGDWNTAIGYEALYSNTSGGANTATGFHTLFTNSTGYNNTAIGSSALGANTIGINNTACGVNALVSNSSGQNNAATGSGALLSNTTGTGNTAIGFNALRSSTTAITNTAIGANALSTNTTGNRNVAEGAGALQRNTGSSNTALGFNAGANLTTGSNNIDIGNAGVAGESSTIRIGSPQTRTFIAGIRGRTTGMANAIPVLIDSAGQLGTMSSSARFKKEIKLMDDASKAIHALRPVMFQYKSDKTNRPEFGLIAEEVAEVNPDLVVREADGELYTVRYDAVNAMLLNEFLKEHRHGQEQDATIARLQKQIEALTAGLQKVSAQIELSKAAPQTVLNNQ